MMNRAIFIVISVTLITGCTTVAKVKQATVIGRSTIEKVVDIKMNASRRFVCNNTYRAETSARARWNISGKNFKTFCGRPTDLTR